MSKNALALTVALVLLCLSGCSASGRENADAKEAMLLMTPAHAKATALAMDAAILDTIPSRFVASHQTQELGGFLACSGGGWTWYNHVFVTFTPDYDMEEILSAVEEHWRDDPRFELDRTLDILGTPRLRFSGVGHSNYYVNIDESDATGDIAAFSPCLELPEGTDHRDKF